MIYSSLFVDRFKKDFKENLDFLYGLEFFIGWHGIPYDYEQYIEIMKDDYKMPRQRAIKVFKQLKENRCIFSFRDADKKNPELFKTNRTNPLIQYFIRKYSDTIVLDELDRSGKGAKSDDMQRM